MKPLVTVITITHNLVNAGRDITIRQCVESVHNQTYENIEHIIIDGASTDGTLDILREYEEKGWITCHSEPDTGIYNAFNKGILKAKGEYIIFLNSDDFYHSKFGIEKSVKALLKSNADYSYAPIYMMNESNPKKTCVFKPQMYKIFHKMPFGHPSMMCKKSILIKEGMFDESYKLAADYEFIVKLKLKDYKGIRVNHLFATFRAGGESDLNGITSQVEYVKIFKKLYKPLYSPDSQDESLYPPDFPPILVLKLIKYHSLKDKLPWFFYSLRKFFLEIRISKKQPKLKILGFWIIKPNEN